jgi:hypothetical protein
MSKIMQKSLSSAKVPRILFIVPIGLALLLGSTSCGSTLTPQQIKENAEKEAQNFAQPLGLTVTSCVGNDSDLNEYVSCTFKDKNGQLAEAECAYSPSVNTGCKLKNRFNDLPALPVATPQ